MIWKIFKITWSKKNNELESAWIVISAHDLLVGFFYVVQTKTEIII